MTYDNFLHLVGILWINNTMSLYVKNLFVHVNMFAIILDTNLSSFFQVINFQFVIQYIYNQRLHMRGIMFCHEVHSLKRELKWSQTISETITNLKILTISFLWFNVSGLFFVSFGSMLQDYFLFPSLNVSRLLFVFFGSMFQDFFISLSLSTQFFLHFRSPFSLYSFIYTCLQPFMSCNLKYTHIKNNIIYLLTFQRNLNNSNIVVPFDPNLYEQDAIKEGGQCFLFCDNSILFCF